MTAAQLAPGASRKRRRAVGVFDSGLGGLTVVREIRRSLPEESVVYFGDIARLPYGIKSKEQIRKFSIENTLFLARHHVKAVVIACNSSSSAAYDFLKNQFNFPVIDVIGPAVEEAVRRTRNGRIGVIGTRATVNSRAYEKALKKKNPKLKVFSCACPLFVSLVEEGWLQGKITRDIVRNHLAPLRGKGIDVLILGCTHYPMLREVIARQMGDRIAIVDSAAPTVGKLKTILDARGLNYPGVRKGRLEIFVSDMPGNFVRVGEAFLGEKLNHVEVVRQS